MAAGLGAIGAIIALLALIAGTGALILTFAWNVFIKDVLGGPHLPFEGALGLWLLLSFLGGVIRRR